MRVFLMRALRGFARGAVWFGVFVGVLAAAVFLGDGLLSMRAASAEEGTRLLPVETVRVSLQDSYRAARRFPGRISAAQVSDVGFQVGGEVIEVLVEVGDAVEAGAPLARIDATRLKLRIGELQASQAEARASLARAEATLERTRALLKDGFATAQNLDDIVAERDGLRARVRQLGRALENARVDLKDANLRAPFSGVVVGRYLDAGATVAAGQPIVRLNENGALEATVGVPGRFARRITVGDAFTLTSADLSASAVVTGVGDEIDEATQTVSVRLEIAEDPGFIPGGLVRISLEEERRGRGAWTPALALAESYRGLWSVYVVEPDETSGDDGGEREGVIVRKDVEIIHIGNERVYVRGALEDGDLVVTAAPFRFVPGQRVRPVERTPVRTLSDGSSSAAAVAAAAADRAGETR